MELLRYGIHFSRSEIPTDFDNAELAEALKAHHDAARCLEAFDAFLTAECGGQPWRCSVCDGELIPAEGADDASKGERAQTAPYWCQRKECRYSGYRFYRLTHSRSSLLEESRKRLSDAAARVRLLVGGHR